LVYSIHNDNSNHDHDDNDPTELVIQRRVEGIETTLKLDSKAKPGAARLNPAIRRHFELEISTLQNAPRDVDKLELLLRVKKRENDNEARHIQDTQKLVTEIEMLQFVLCLVRRRRSLPI
jgi:hypothetical protein